MLALRVGDTVLRRGQPEAEFGAVDGAHAQLASGVSESHHPVHAVVVGQRDRVQPGPGRLLDQLLGVGGAVEEAEVRMHMQLGVGDTGQTETGVVPVMPLHQIRGCPRVALAVS